MCQGLPYWASGSQQLLSPCNNYKLQRTQLDPLYSCRFTYTDCMGLRVVVDLYPPDQMQMHVCSNTVPVFSGPGNPPIVNPTGTATLQGACSSNVPNIPCTEEQSYQEGPDKKFSTNYNVLLGSATGSGTFWFNNYVIPVKYVIKIGTSVILDTGYRGSSTLQSELNQKLADRGLPPETIQGVGNATLPYIKSTSSTTAVVTVYSPWADEAATEVISYHFNLSCPS